MLGEEILCAASVTLLRERKMFVMGSMLITLIREFREGLIGKEMKAVFSAIYALLSKRKKSGPTAGYRSDATRSICTNYWLGFQDRRASSLGDSAEQRQQARNLPTREG